MPVNSLIARWKFDGDALDVVGTNHGTGGTFSTNGRVNTAGVYGSLITQTTVPSAPFEATGTITITAWVKRSNNGEPIFGDCGAYMGGSISRKPKCLF